jgi:hypothetical protein
LSLTNTDNRTTNLSILLNAIFFERWISEIDLETKVQSINRIRSLLNRALLDSRFVNLSKEKKNSLRWFSIVIQLFSQTVTLSIIVDVDVES